MRGASLPERRRAEFARLSEIDDAVDAFMDRSEFDELAPDVRELVAVAVKALLGVVRRFDDHELALVLPWLPGSTVAIGYRDGVPGLELSDRPPDRAADFPDLSAGVVATDPRGDLVVPTPRPPQPPPHGPAADRFPARRPDPGDPVDPADPADGGDARPPSRRRVLRDDVAAELAALREATRRRTGSHRDAGPG